MHNVNGNSRSRDRTGLVHSPDSRAMRSPSPWSGIPRAEEATPPAVPIPESLLIMPTAYQTFLRKNRLHEVVEGLLEGVDASRLEDLQRASAQIKGIFHSSPIPESLENRIRESCDRLGDGTVLVWPVTLPYGTFRSSAEYQEQSYLEARNTVEVISAIKTWWASLFDAAAIRYRERSGQSHLEATITVAVQQAASARATNPTLPW